MSFATFQRIVKSMFKVNGLPWDQNYLEVLRNIYNNNKEPDPTKAYRFLVKFGDGYTERN